MNDKAIELINKALGLIYDTMHPTPKVAISNILTKIKAELAEQPVCKTCGGLKVVCKDGIGLMFGGVAAPCPDCKKPEAGEYNADEEYNCDDCTEDCQAAQRLLCRNAFIAIGKRQAEALAELAEQPEDWDKCRYCGACRVVRITGEWQFSCACYDPAKRPKTKPSPREEKKPEAGEFPVCETCGGSKEIFNPNVISMGPRPKIPCPKCSQPEAGEFTSKKNYIEDYLSKTRYRLTTGTRDEEMDKFARWFLEACDRLDQQAERIKKMYAGDLSPESRLAGYSVVVKAQKKRIKQLEAEKKRLEADIIKMNDKCVKIRRGLEADLEKYGQHGKLCPRRYGDELNPCLCGFDQARKGKGE